MMHWRHSRIRTRTLAISLGPALLLTLLLTGYLTYSRLQDLHEELTQTGQLIADQLAPATEYGVISGNIPILEGLLQASLEIPHVRYIEVRDRSDAVLAYVEQPRGGRDASIEVFEARILRQQVRLDDPFLISPPLPLRTPEEDRLGRVLVGMTDEAFERRQTQILLRASLLALMALVLTLLLAYRLARSLSEPIHAMGRALEAIKEGNYQAELPVADRGEIGDLARHINRLAAALEQAQAEQQRSIAQLVAAREEAEQASRAKSDFLAMMSHELRTPMNGVLGMLQLLETTEQSSEQAEYTALATESTEHLLKVINDILDFSRIERGSLELEHIPFQLPELIANSVQVFRPGAQQRGLELRLDLQPGLENLEVRGDPTRLRQILVNLIGNALKFTEQGHVTVNVRWQVLDQQQMLWLTVAVRDTGIGIAPERLQHMFDAFEQADSSTSRRFGGTGLGLSIARTLAERMGGGLHAESTLGEGSTFTLELPLPWLHRQSDERVLLDSELTAGSGQTVLLVEDNPVNQTVIEAILRSLGCIPQLAGNGQAALQAVAQQPFAAILMDCRLPDLDGCSATRQIRSGDGPNRHTPIIALTANALQGDREACLAAGMNDYLAKPFKRSDLRAILQRWVHNRP
ncbi:ATP-binding protein [Pseudomonas stutzeri]|nr:ATP-binding protein [Stutzerimonas stutzeri]